MYIENSSCKTAFPRITMLSQYLQNSENKKNLKRRAARERLVVEFRVLVL
jgi:hypothetical protein